MSIRLVVHGLRPPSAPLRSLRPILHKSFHSTRSNHLIHEALQVSHYCFESVHDLTGLSWAYSIPLTAVLFRACWFPVTWWASTRNARTAEYMPLLAAKREYFKIAATLRFLNPTSANAIKAERWVQLKMLEVEKDYRKKFRAISGTAQFMWNIGFLPVWIVNADVVRRMAGMNTSLLGWLMGNGEKLDPAVVPPEPSLMAESFYWVSELGAADAVWGLPLIFAALQLSNGWLTLGRGLAQTKAELVDARKANPGGPLSKALTQKINLQTTFLSLVALSPVVCVYYEIPAAVVLFMIGSATSQLVQRHVMQRLSPKPKIYKPLRPRFPKMKPGLPSTVDDKSVFGGSPF